jgi:hypothetical protein
VKEHGGHVLQIKWISTCSNLQILRLRNFVSQTTADEKYLLHLPQNLTLKTWQMSGRLHLNRSRCEHFGFPQPLEDSHIKLDPDELPVGIIAGVSGSFLQSKLLDFEVVRRWQCGVVCVSYLLLDFSQFAAYYVKFWSEDNVLLHEKPEKTKKRRREDTD